LFLFDGPVRMQGRGERVTPLEIAVPTLFGVLVRPASGVPTGPAYAAIDALPNRITGTATERLLADPTKLFDALANDFAAPVLSQWPDVAFVEQSIREAGALKTQLCGSGSTVFGLARDAAHALVLVKALVGKHAWVKKVQTI
jgi:4-diphosphocytidyl-2-C-methyl-D-erythritol kinase